MAINSLHEHHYENNEHLSCNKNDTTHLHELHDDDCSLYHFQLSNTLLFYHKSIIKSVLKINIKHVFNYLSYHKNNHSSLKSLRGPPYFLI